MKKAIALFLAAIMTVSLTACGGSFQVELENKNEGTTTTETITIITEAGADDEVSTTTTEKKQQQKTTTKQKTPTTTKKSTTTTTKKSTTTTKKPAATTTTTKPFKKGTMSLANGSELKTSSGLSGLYKVCGYSSTSIGGNLSLVVNFKGVEVENEGEVDLSEANIEHINTDVFDFVYFKITFDGTTIKDWDIVDRKTQKSVLALSEKELMTKYFPETTFKTIKVSKLPDNIYVSKYELNTIYEFSIPKNETVSIPTIINDSQYAVIIVSTEWDGEWNRKYEFKHNTGISFGMTSSSEGKYRIAFMKGETDDIMASESNECFLLAGCKKGETLDKGSKDYIVNNTSKTITLYATTKYGAQYKFTLKPNEILKASTQDTVKVIEIK